MVEEVDELWGPNPPTRYHERAVAKDLFFNYRSPDFADFNRRKNDFLSNPTVHSEVKTIIEEIKAASEKELRKSILFFNLVYHYPQLLGCFKMN